LLLIWRSANLEALELVSLKGDQGGPNACVAAVASAHSAAQLTQWQVDVTWIRVQSCAVKPIASDKTLSVAPRLVT
jgi:hypothetical protein